MKALLDECSPKKLQRAVAAEVVKTVPEMGWASIVNGALLHLAEQEFDVFLTNDQHLEHQQNLKKVDLAIVVLAASTNDIADLLPLMPAVNDAMRKVGAGDIIYIRASAS